MSRRTSLFTVALLLIAVVTLWYIQLSYDSAQRSREIAATNAQSYIDIQTQGVGTFYVQLTQTASNP